MSTDSIFDQLTKIQSWPSVGLVLALCIVAGYAWRFCKFKWFPNDAIPPIVILTGGLGMLILAGDQPAGATGLGWHARQFIVGVIIGFVAWLAHNLVISKIEDWISSLFPSVAKLLNKEVPPVPAWILIGSLSLGVAGCSMLAPGADPFVVRVEQGQQIADGAITFVLHVDQADRGFWKTNAPAFHTFCEWLRTPLPYEGSNLQRCLVIEANVQQLKRTYKSARTTENSNALWIAFDVLNTAANQSLSWSNIVTTPVH